MGYPAANVMAYAGYLLVSVRLVSTLAPGPAMECGFILLNMNPVSAGFFVGQRLCLWIVGYVNNNLVSFRWMRDDKVRDIGGIWLPGAGGSSVILRL